MKSNCRLCAVIIALLLFDLAIVGAARSFWNGQQGGYEPNGVGFFDTTLSVTPLTVSGTPTTMLCSYWALMPDISAIGPGARFLNVQNTGTKFTNLQIVGGDTDIQGISEWAAVSASVTVDTSTSFWQVGYWYNVLVYMDVGHAQGSKVLQQYINDVSANANGVDNSPTQNFTFWNGATITIGLVNANLSLADLQCWLGATTDLSVTANRRNFIDANKNPVNPTVAAATFGTPTLLFTGNAASWTSGNQGSAGGTPTVTAGTITDVGWTPAGIPGLGP